ncbi:MAG: excinuclease ABC subunit UvrC, partial [Deltaproteobacteria bacterium]|nr:excinuclease ABC subunit UvrC [Deltaproteobacteria bacterium]
YRAVVDEVVLFLKGRTPELVERIRQAMKQCADRLDFEAAAAHRDRLLALEKTLEKQTAVTADFADRDVLGLARKGAAALVMLLFVRNGYLLGSRAFYFPEAVASDQELLCSFVHQFYEQALFVPKEILLPAVPEGRNLLEEMLGERKGAKVYLLIPKRGEKAKIVKMATKNAQKALEQRLQALENEEGLLALIQKRLALARRPERIACLDLSNVAGAEGVGAIVVFDHGRPSRKDYRRYRIKAASGRDDYGMLREVLTRRYQKDEDSLPDLLVVDGGKGQLNAAAAVLKQMGLWGRLDVIGIAKRAPERGDTHDKVYKPGRKNPVSLTSAPQVLLFFQRIRDEAHRYVITYHKKRRMMTYRKSVLDTVPGVGEKRRQRLLKHFGSLKRIKEASFEEVLAVPGMTRKAAGALVEVLNREKERIAPASGGEKTWSAAT